MCNGTGKKYSYDHITEDRPEMPIELTNHMRDAFSEWLKNKAMIDAEDERNPVTYI
jgi:hypothetical protein